jgi:hypothetical protein
MEKDLTRRVNSLKIALGVLKMLKQLKGHMHRAFLQYQKSCPIDLEYKVLNIFLRYTLMEVPRIFAGA